MGQAGNVDTTERLCYHAFVRTTIEISDDLWLKLKILAAQEKKSLREVIEALIERALCESAS